MKVFTVLGTILAALLGLCFFNLKIRICLLQEDTTISGKVVLRILNFLGWTFKFPSRISKPKPPNKLPSPGRILDFSRTFLQINIWLIKHIKCTRFIWKTKLGVGDAAATGIGSGLLWSIKGFLLGLLKRTVDWEDCKVEIDVIPIFNGKAMKTEFDCIFYLRTGYIIIACVRLLVLCIIFNLVPKGVKLT